MIKILGWQVNGDSFGRTVKNQLDMEVTNTKETMTKISRFMGQFGIINLGSFAADL